MKNFLNKTQIRKKHFDVITIGAGTGGLSSSTRLLKKKNLNLAIFDSVPSHFYQPGWTLVGGGIMKKQETIQPIDKNLPSGCTFISDSVELIEPENNTILTSKGEKHTYDYLIISTGFKINLNGIKGLKEALDSKSKKKNLTQ
jgi:sulfide:quinone oxidoreductase